jgi:hypothetical protein
MCSGAGAKKNNRHAFHRQTFGAADSPRIINTLKNPTLIYHRNDGPCRIAAARPRRKTIAGRYCLCIFAGRSEFFGRHLNRKFAAHSSVDENGYGLPASRQHTKANGRATR